MMKFDFNKHINEHNNLQISSYTMNSLGGDASVGFVYQVLPLAFNLEQSDAPRKEHLHDHFKFHHGDSVQGISPYDNKEHKGIIQHIYYDDKGNKPVLVYIMDLKINAVIPIEVESLKHIKKVES